MQNRKKGFTLIEIAIVLVVIGIVLGIVMKGRSIIGAAKVRAEIVKINLIQTAYLSYWGKYGVLPGANPAIAANRYYTSAIYADLLKDGIVSPKDFKSDLYEGYWNFIGCSDTPDGWALGGKMESYKYFCMFLTDAKPENVHMGSAINYSLMSPQMACYLENMLDDGNLLTGYGRQGGKGFPMVINDLNRCALESDKASPRAFYAIRVY